MKLKITDKHSLKIFGVFKDVYVFMEFTLYCLELSIPNLILY